MTVLRPSLPCFFSFIFFNLFFLFIIGLIRVVTVGMEIEHNNKWVCMKRTADNYFTISGLGEIKFPKKFRITSISGEQLVATVSEVTDDVNIPTNIQYSGFNPGKAISGR